MPSVRHLCRCNLWILRKHSSWFKTKTRVGCILPFAQLCQSNSFNSGFLLWHRRLSFYSLDFFYLALLSTIIPSVPCTGSKSGIFRVCNRCDILADMSTRLLQQGHQLQLYLRETTALYQYCRPDHCNPEPSATATDNHSGANNCS